MADWFIATEGVKVVKDSASLWPQIITAVSSAGAALGGVCLTHRFTRRREERAAADKAAAERRYIATELVFLLERYAVALVALEYFLIHELHEKNKTPVLNLSVVNSDWRTLPAHLIFRLRLLETYQADLLLRIERKIVNENPIVSVPLSIDCLKMGIFAFILAAKLRREVGLPDSVHLRGKQEVFGRLRSRRKLYWRKIVLQKRRAKEMPNGSDYKDNDRLL